MEKTIKIIIFLILIWLFDYIGIRGLKLNSYESMKMIIINTWEFFKTTSLFIFIPALLKLLFKNKIDSIFIFICIIHSILLTLILYLNDFMNENFKIGLIGPVLYVFITIWLLRDDEKNKTLKNNVEDL